jgi:putative acetyltransferase
MITYRPATPNDLDRMFNIWLAAIEATHGFLSEADGAFYGRLVREDYLPHAQLDIAETAADGVVAFMGLGEGKVDALFVDPSWHGQGIGRALLERALQRWPSLDVDVNEQNSPARAFYRKMGFREIGRSECDGCGKPYPLIHLRHSA